MPMPTPATWCWGRRSATGPPSGAAWRRGCWTARGWSKLACGERATRLTPTSGAGHRVSVWCKWKSVGLNPSHP
ncbi:hypothetical protein CRUP_015230 [Coryphaenoides rupestris]|nr:hypothetical protein CRUP_015230 [Coryphaenoides rupestris]